MRMHTGDKTFTCKVCDKSFNTKWHLKEHSKWHSAEKPFLCSECGQRYFLIYIYMFYFYIIEKSNIYSLNSTSDSSETIILLRICEDTTEKNHINVGIAAKVFREQQI